MRAKVSVKSKELGDPKETERLKQLFNQMLGKEDAEPDIVIPKYINMSNLIIDFLMANDAFTEHKSVQESYAEAPGDIKEIEAFNNKTKLLLGIQKYDYLKSDALDVYRVDAHIINEKFKRLRDSNEVKNIIISGAALSQYHDKLVSKNGNFINAISTFQPLEFSSLDFTKLWVMGSGPFRDVIIQYLSKVDFLAHAIYEINTSPLIPVSELCDLIVKKISLLQTQIPRCDEAFRIIQQSVGTMEENFNSYYKNSIEAGKPDTIIHSFILDIANKHGKRGLLVKSQFSRILRYYQDKQAHMDPQTSELLKSLQQQLAMGDAQEHLDKADEKKNEPMPDLASLLSISSSHQSIKSEEKKPEEKKTETVIPIDEKKNEVVEEKKNETTIAIQPSPKKLTHNEKKHLHRKK